jgi:hypothetical protein
LKKGIRIKRNAREAYTAEKDIAWLFPEGR